MNTALQVAFIGLAGVLMAVAVVWFYAGLGTWIDDAFDNGRWVWFGLLLLFTFPASLIAWLIIRAMRNRHRMTA